MPSADFCLITSGMGRKTGQNGAQDMVNYNVWSKKKTSNDVFFKELLVGTAGFEPTAPYYTLFEWANITKSIKVIKYSSLVKFFH